MLSTLINMTNVPKISHRTMTDLTIMSFIIWCGNNKIKIIIIIIIICVTKKKPC